MQHMLYTQDHIALQDSLKKFMRSRDQPARRRMGGGRDLPGARSCSEDGRARLPGRQQAGGIRRPGPRLLLCRWPSPKACGDIHCGGVPMAIGVQTDMATPALARFGSDELRREFLAPSIAGDFVACLGVSEVGRRLRRRLDQDPRAQGRRRLRHQRRQDVDHQRHPGRLDAACWPTPARARAHKQQDADLRADEDQGRRRGAQAEEARHGSSDTAQLYFDDVRVPQRYRIGEEGMGFTYQMQQFQEERLWAAAGWRKTSEIIQRDHRLHARAPGLRQAAPRQPVHLLQAGRTEDRGRGAARAGPQARWRCTWPART